VSHLRAADGTVVCEHEDDHVGTSMPALALVEHDEHHEHSHGLVNRSVLRSRAGIRAVSWSLGILTPTPLRHSSATTSRASPSGAGRG